MSCISKTCWYKKHKSTLVFQGRQHLLLWLPCIIHPSFINLNPYFPLSYPPPQLFPRVSRRFDFIPCLWMDNIAWTIINEHLAFPGQQWLDQVWVHSLFRIIQNQWYNETFLEILEEHFSFFPPGLIVEKRKFEFYSSIIET